MDDEYLAVDGLAWVFGSRIGDKPFSEKYLKKILSAFGMVMMFYFGGIFLLYIFFTTF